MSKMLIRLLAVRRDRVHKWAKLRLTEIDAMEFEATISRRDARNVRKSITGLAIRTQEKLDKILAKFGWPS